MLVVRINPKSRRRPASVEQFRQNMIREAKDGVVVLPEYAELLAAVPDDEEIKVVQQSPKAPGIVVPREEWRAAMEYIQALHDCATCKHETDGTACLASDVDCTACAERASCACANCHNGSGWKWRYGHGQ